MCLFLVFWFFVYFFFFKQKTAYEMRISDWSSDVCSSDLCDRLTDMAGGIRDRAERLRIAEPRRNFLRFLVDHPGDGKCLALNRDGDVPAPITLREEPAAHLQRLRKSRAVVRHGPALPNGFLYLFGVETFPPWPWPFF